MLSHERHVVPGKRNRKEHRERRAKAHVRRDAEEEAVGIAGHQVFLGEQLDAVGERLQPAEFAANARGAEAVLNATSHFPLEPNEDERTHCHQVDQQPDVN